MKRALPLRRCSLLGASVLLLGAAIATGSPIGRAEEGPPGRPAAATASPGTPIHYLPDRFAGRAGRYYKLVWGIDSLSVKVVESGEMVRFSWRVLDPERAKVLNDKHAEPALVDAQAGAQLVVPSLEQIGQMRQSAPPVSGKSYWMAFSNKGRLVRRGDRVDVIVGPFRADGLVVD